MKTVIFHNPRCSKSREALSLLRENGCDPEIIEYLKQSPTAEEITALLKKLRIPAEELVRKKEALYISEFKNKNISEQEWIAILAKHPILIERPVIISGNKAIIGRPPAKVLELIQ